MGRAGASPDCGQYDRRQCNGPPLTQSTFHLNYEDLFNQVYPYSVIRYFYKSAVIVKIAMELSLYFICAYISPSWFLSF